MLNIDIEKSSLEKINKIRDTHNNNIRVTGKSSTSFKNGGGIIMEFQSKKHCVLPTQKAMNKLSLIFALQTGKNFEDTKIGDQQTHDDIMEQSENLFLVFEEMNFNDIIQNYTYDDINMMMMCEPNYELLFPDNDSHNKYYTIIFVEDLVFIIMADRCGYMLRDAHNITQYNFTNINDLIYYLYDHYDIGDTNYVAPFKYIVKKC